MWFQQLVKKLTKKKIIEKVSTKCNDALIILPPYICIGDSMVSSAIWKKTCTSEFFKDDRNLKSLKNSRVYVFSNCTRNHTITC